MFKKRSWRAAAKPREENSDEEEEKTPEINPERARRKTFDRAVNLLAYKPRSVKELRERLLEKTWTNEEIVDAVLEKLKEYNYLNDENFARELAASKLRQKPIGKRVLKQKLALRKLNKETVDEAIEQAFEEAPEEEIIKQSVTKRLRLKGKPETREDAKKFYDYLLRQGFSYDLVSRKMREIASKDFDENE
ncbi:MAG: RecX family transcriptional regulator [Acidobacteria bacterium]|jgi:regulatory protein|nr:RecX family transcriptional regulator [Acidobacteriota bacterium]